MLRLRPLRSHLSSSNVFAVSLRRPVSPRLDVSCPLGTFDLIFHIASREALTVSYVPIIRTNTSLSDGIARVHGMSNVQAEELVE